MTCSGASHFLLRVAQWVERKACFFQGKGYGTASIVHECDLVHRLLTVKPSIAVDIGGNIGDYTAEIRRRTPDVVIHDFEPSSTNIAKLSARFASDKNIKIIPYAVSEFSGSASLFSNEPGSGLGSLSKRDLDHLHIDFNISEPVNTLRFEDYWKTQLASADIQFVKIDIEGHELSALRGFGAAIHHIQLIQFEFGGCNIDTRTYFKDFWRFFSEHRFDLYRITPFSAHPVLHYSELDEFFSTTNFIACNRDFK